MRYQLKFLVLSFSWLMMQGAARAAEYLSVNESAKLIAGIATGSDKLRAIEESVEWRSAANSGTLDSVASKYKSLRGFATLLRMVQMRGQIERGSEKSRHATFKNLFGLGRHEVFYPDGRRVFYPFG